MFTVQVAGRTYPLELTVQAFAGISELCPGGDFARFSELLNAAAGRRVLHVAALACVLSEAAEAKAAFLDPAHTPEPLTMAAVMQLSVPALNALQGTVLECITDGLSGKTVELADSKKATAENESR